MCKRNTFFNFSFQYNTVKMDSFFVAELTANWINCARYFEDKVHPLLVSTFPGLRIDFDCGDIAPNLNSLFL